MRTLVIPDIHHHTENADYWVKTQICDRVIYLGDYFDDFDDNANDAGQTARWLRQQMERSQDIFLLGNHDAAYMFPDMPELYCPGFHKTKSRAINEVLTPAHWKRFRLAFFDGEWLYSHAGFHPSWIEGTRLEGVLNRCDEALKKAWKHQFDPILGTGADRQGNQQHGGPLWMDWNCLVPIENINQIVGHTPGQDVREKHSDDSNNYCLDVNNGFAAAVIDDGLFVLKRPLGL